MIMVRMTTDWEKKANSDFPEKWPLNDVWGMSVLVLFFQFMISARAPVFLTFNKQYTSDTSVWFTISVLVQLLSSALDTYL